jgi:predicted amidophosphoribosyltransferase
MNPTGLCPGCDRTWNGERACHCSTCHRHFSGLTAFDAHRPGQCIDPATLHDKDGQRMWRQDDNGVWRSAKEWVRT